MTNQGTTRRGVRRPLSVAPMMDRTDRHCRAFLRRITRRTLLYSEMITAAAVIHGDRDHLLGHSEEERPLALQLGGDEPGELAQAARIAEEWGYDEVDLNVGCPSDRVKKGRFGACLMAEPQRVAAAVAAMRDAVDLPVTVKHRIGIDQADRYEDMLAFVTTVAAAGCDRFSVHARKAWLSGLSPKENRTLPPLRHEEVHRLKRELPHLAIVVNGGIRDLAAARRHLEAGVDGVMIGRAAYDDPYLFAAADRDVFAQPEEPPSRRRVIEELLPYVERQLVAGVPLKRVARHLLGLFAGRPGARAWKRHLAENAHLEGAGPEVLLAAMARVPAEVLDESPPAVTGATLRLSA
ncbi:MAG TPA: tRNA dihydrouridine(20/20a) synthase DusA [Thermoanaerobaculia bacterium]|nr:tRNA dihydrouridine(20/20a) synthase DusA [Thermoanaerobaculia bacterium]